MIRRARKVVIRSENDMRIACYVLGPRKARTAILSSGIGCGPVFLNKVARELAKDHRVVYWDYRGHGRSDPAPAGSGYRISDHARDLAAVVQRFSPRRRPILLGFSMGVQVQVEWIRKHPDRAQAHIFLLGLPRNPLHRTVLFRQNAARAAYHFARAARPLLLFAQPAFRLALRTPLTYLLARSGGVVSPKCSQRDFLEFVHFATSVPLDAYLECSAGLFEHDGSDVFSHIEQPVLMLAGQNDVLVNMDECKRFARKLPKGRFRMIPKGSHAGSIERGGFVARHVRKFLSDPSTDLCQAA